MGWVAVGDCVGVGWAAVGAGLVGTVVAVATGWVWVGTAVAGWVGTLVACGGWVGAVVAQAAFKMNSPHKTRDKNGNRLLIRRMVFPRSWFRI
jgi:uncharacterized membrane protein YsdA (DUF1294 family)